MSEAVDVMLETVDGDHVPVQVGVQRAGVSPADLVDVELGDALASGSGPRSASEALTRAKGVRVRQFVGRGGVKARVDVLAMTAQQQRNSEPTRAVDAFEAEQGIVEELGDAELARLWCNTLLAELEGRDPAPDGLWELFEEAQRLWAGLEGGGS